MKTMQKVFDNLINGNLKDAKHRARRFGVLKLVYFGRDEFGFKNDKAWAAALYLKNKGSFQAYCDAK